MINGEILLNRKIVSLLLTTLKQLMTLRSIIVFYLLLMLLLMDLQFSKMLWKLMSFIAWKLLMTMLQFLKTTLMCFKYCSPSIIGAKIG